MRRILVIKLGALGDFVQATGAFADIRAHEADAHITLLTAPALAPLAKDAPWFDDVTYDTRKPFWNLPYVVSLTKKLRGYDFVYDLQTNQRSHWYFKLAGKPQWSGIASGCSHPHTNPERNHLHTIARIRDQLRMAGVPNPSHLPDLTYIDADISQLLQAHNLTPGAFACLVPGCAPHRPEKRWPHYVELVQALAKHDIPCVLVGTKAEKPTIEHISRETIATDLCGKTGLRELIALFKQARFVVGNDTGPMHMAAAAKVPAVVLFGSGSDPALCAPQGEQITILHKDNIATITPQQVSELLGL